MLVIIHVTLVLVQIMLVLVHVMLVLVHHMLSLVLVLPSDQGVNVLVPYSAWFLLLRYGKFFHSIQALQMFRAKRKMWENNQSHRRRKRDHSALRSDHAENRKLCVSVDHTVQLHEDANCCGTCTLVCEPNKAFCISWIADVDDVSLPKQTVTRTQPKVRISISATDFYIFGCFSLLDSHIYLCISALQILFIHSCFGRLRPPRNRLTRLKSPKLRIQKKRKLFLRKVELPSHVKSGKEKANSPVVSEKRPATSCPSSSVWKSGRDLTVFIPVYLSGYSDRLLFTSAMAVTEVYKSEWMSLS